MFAGDPEADTGSNTVTPSTFMKRFRAHMRDLGITTDSQRIDALVGYLMEDSPAEKWYTDLKADPAGPKTWAA
jgi:hypothetical protein